MIICQVQVLFEGNKIINRKLQKGQYWATWYLCNMFFSKILNNQVLSAWYVTHLFGAVI